MSRIDTHKWWMLVVIGLAVTVGLTEVTGRAQSVAQFENWKETATGRRPNGRCSDLRALTNYDFSVDAATLIPPQADVPEFCLVQGQILPEVRFEVSLPTAWNGRLYMFGNGGNAGEPFTTPVRIRRRNAALERGFAVTATNTGHDNTREPGRSFAVNPQKFIDFAYRAVHVTAVTAKDISRSYYATPPTRAYFDGCSQGGRQGLISAQRFPEDFDGIVVGAPVLDLAGMNAHSAKIFLALAASPHLAEKIELLAERVYKKCDAVDGLADGVIDDPRRCQFNPAADLPRCTSGESEGACFTAAEIRSLEAIYGDVVSNRTKIFPGLPVGAEVLVPTPAGLRSGWAGTLIPPGPVSSLNYLEEDFKYMTNLDWRAFELDRDFEKLRISMLPLLATDPDLSRFRSRSGKVIMYFGWADPGVNPLMGVDYYERVRETMGPATPEFFRLFMMPGVFHCGGGVGPNLADTFTPLVDWVERGIAPDRIVATLRREGKIVRTRPLCPYPLVAKYKGSGSIDEATNFVCSNP